MKEKAQKSSNNHSVSSKPGGDEMAPSENENDALSEDELAVFRKIMGEIEGQEETNGGLKDNGATEEEDRTLESVAEIKAPHLSDDVVDASNDDLDEEQLKAFESIMAQIEGGAKEPPAPSAEAEPIQADAADSETDDFAAELEKVAKAAESAEPDADDSSDDLDEEQLKAFESIMAQIEGGAKEPPAPSAEAEPIQADAADSETDDFAAELEKVAKAAENAEPDADGSSDDLDADQQKALESILAQIEKGDDTDVMEIDEVVSNPDEADKVVPAAEEIRVARKERQSPAPKTVLTAEKADDTPQPIQAQVVDRKTAGPMAETSSEQTEAAEIKNESATSVNDAARVNRPIPDSKSTLRGGKRKRLVTMAAVCAILGLSIGGYTLWSNHRPVANLPSPPISPTPPAARPPAPPSQTVAPSDPGKPEVGASSDVTRLKEITGTLDQLRGQLIAKQGEIDELRTYYQSGIDAEVSGIIEAVRKSGAGAVAFKSAMEDPRISLGLSAIQRRNAYIRRLKIPVNALARDSEELLYLTRKAVLFALMAEKSSDIDVDGFIRHATDVMDAHRQRLVQLNIDTVEVVPLSLESIWQDITGRLSVKPAATPPPPSPSGIDNTSIWKAICAGDYSQKDHLTALSTEAARCLSTWKGRDLFLNMLGDLSPDAARELVHWKGDWLGLNGLKELTPEVASYLARWKGKTLSLNGLSRLSPQVVAILSEWQGEQIELINVGHALNWDNPRIQIFFSEELQRKQTTVRK